MRQWILTSRNKYDLTGSHYNIFFGKVTCQELHFWHHDGNDNQAKWVYGKDPNYDWHNFYNALHKKPPAGEKIISWYRLFSGNSNNQIWAYIM